MRTNLLHVRERRILVTGIYSRPPMDRFVEMQFKHVTVLQAQTPRGLAEAHGKDGVWQLSSPYRHEAIVMRTRSVARVRARLEMEIDRGMR